jgi:multidrug transporter EmrE-like cation transporter
MARYHKQYAHLSQDPIPVRKKIETNHKMNWQVLGYGTALALMDVIMMPVVKFVSCGKLPMWSMAFTTLMYAAAPWVFLKSLSVDGMVVMNVIWDLVSIVIVTLIGLVFMGEKVNFVKKIGIVLSFVCIYLLGSA